jgi:hypothetical protein
VALTKAVEDNAALRRRLTSMQLLVHYHTQQPMRASVATSPFSRPAQVHVGTSPAPAIERLALQAPPSRAPAPTPPCARTVLRAASPLRAGPLCAGPLDTLIDLAPASHVTAHALWERWCRLGHPKQFDKTIFSEASRGPFQRYRTFAKVVQQLSLVDRAANPIGILNKFLAGLNVYVVCV